MTSLFGRLRAEVCWESWAEKPGRGVLFVCRLIALLFACAAMAALGGDVWQAIAGGGWQPQALGQLWFSLDSGSLNLAQAVIQRYLYPWLWDPAFVQVLLWPAWVVPGTLALVLFLLCRRRHSQYGRPNGNHPRPYGGRL